MAISGLTSAFITPCYTTSLRIRALGQSSAQSPILARRGGRGRLFSTVDEASEPTSGPPPPVVEVKATEVTAQVRGASAGHVVCQG